MARITKAQQKALEEQRMWDATYALSAQLREEEEARRQAAAEEAAANPRGPYFDNVTGGVTSTEMTQQEAAERAASPWNHAIRRAQGDGNMDFLRSLGASTADMAGGIVDAVRPDPNPVAYADARARGDESPWALEETVQNAYDVALGMASNQRRLSDWAGQTNILDAITNLLPFSSLAPDPSTVGAVAQTLQLDRANIGAIEGATRRALGQPSFEELRDQNVFNRGADALYGLGDSLREGRSDEAKAREQRFGEAMSGDFSDAAKYLFSPEGISGLLQDQLPASLPYMAGGMGAARGLAGLGMGAERAAIGGATVSAFAETQNNSREAEQVVLNMAPEALALTPRAQELLARGRSIEDVRGVLAREARMSAIAASVAISPATLIPALNPLENIAAGVASNPLSTTLRRTTLATLAGLGSEAAEEGGQALTSNLGQAAAGVRATEDIGEGVLAQGLVGAALGGPITGAAANIAAGQEMNARAQNLNKIADAADAITARRLAEREAAERETAEEQVRAEGAQRSFITSGPVPVTDGTDNAGRPVESFEQYAEREGAEVTRSEEAQRQFLAQNTLESSNAALDNSLKESPRWSGMDTLLTGTRAQRQAENERLARGVVNEQAEIDRDMEAFEQERERRVAAEAGRTAQLEEAKKLDADTSKGDLKAAEKRRRNARLAALKRAQRENADKPEAERLEAIRQAGVAFDAANPVPTAQEAAAAAAAGSRGRGRPAVRTGAPRASQAPAPAPVAPEALAELGLTEEDVAVEQAPASIEEREAGLRSQFGRADEAGAEAETQGSAPLVERSAGDVIRALAERVRGGNDTKALAQERLLLNGKLSIVDGAEMAQAAPSATNPRGYYDGERMYINASAIPEGKESAAVLNEILVHEADHAARLSGNPDAKSRVRTLLGDGATGRLISQLETSSHPVAVQARDMLAQRGISREADPALYEDELTAYAQTAAARQQAGGVWAPIRGLVSAARRKLKQWTGSEDINLNDLAGYGQDVINALATSEANIEYSGEGRAATDVTEMEQKMLSLTNDSKLPKHERLLAERLAPLMTQFGVQLRPAEENAMLQGDQNIAGVYSPGTNSIHLRVDDSITLLHEGLHAVTSNLLGKTAVGKEDARLQELRAEFDDMLASLRWQVSEGALDGVPSHVRAMFMDEAGVLANTRELLAYGMTEPDVQDVLAKLPAPKRSKFSNMWEWFKNAIAQFYGDTAAERTFLDQLIENTGALVEYANTNPGMVRKVNEATARTYQESIGRADEADPVMGTSVGTAPRVVPARVTPSRASNAAKMAWDNAVTWHGAEGEKMALLIEQSEGPLNSFYMHALSARNRTQRGIELAGRKLARQEGISRKEGEARIDAMLERRMGLIRKLPTQTARDKALTNLVNEYPELAPVQEAIESINAFTKDLIGQRMQDPTPLTAEEVETYEYMARNQSGYLTNVYALFQGKDGAKYADRLASLAQKGYDALANDLPIPKEVREEFRVYDEALKFVIANDVAVSDPEMLAAMSMEDVVNIHDMWAPANEKASDERTRMQNDGTYNKAGFKEVLSDRIIAWVDQASEEQIKNMGKAVVNTLLRLNEMSGPAKRYAKASGIDTSILKHRTPLPKQIADLYGKIEDVPTLLLTTITQMGELTARSQLFNDIRNTGYGDLVVTAADRATDPTKYGAFTVPLSGESFGPLEGMYTTEPVARALSAFSDGFSSLVETVADVGGLGHALGTLGPAVDTAGKVLGKMNSVYKAMAIPTRLDYLILNGIGSVSTPLLVGGVRPEFMVRGMKVAAKSIANTLDPKGTWHDATIDFDSNLAAAMGVMENVVLRDIRTQPRELVKRFIQSIGEADNPSQMREVFRKFKDLGGRGWNAWLEAFSMSDAWIRYPVALQRADFLKKYYAANGEEVSNRRLMDEAAAYAKDVTMTAARSPGLVQGMERRGATMYGNYLMNVPRVLYKNATSIYDSWKMAQDATTQEARELAMGDAFKKVLGYGAFVAATTYGMKMLVDWLMDDDDREQRDIDRVFLQSPTGELAENQYADLLYVGTDEDGNRMYINVSRADAHGPVTDIIRAFRENDNPVDAIKDAAEVSVGLMVKSAMLGEAVKILYQLFGEEKLDSRPSRISKIMPEFTNRLQNATADLFGDAGYRGVEAVLQTADKMAPAGLLNLFDEVNPSPAQIENAAAANAAAVLDLLGHKFVTVKPEQATQSAVYRLRDQRKEANRQIRDTLTNAGPEAAFSAFVRQAQAEREAVASVGELYQGLLDSKYSKRQAQALLKDAGLDATSVANITQRRYDREAEEWVRKYSSLFSSNTIDNPPKKLSAEEQKEWKRQAKEVKRRIRIMTYNDAGDED